LPRAYSTDRYISKENKQSKTRKLGGEKKEKKRSFSEEK